MNGPLEKIRQEDNLTLDSGKGVSTKTLRYLVKPVVRLQQGPCDKPIRSPDTRILNVDAGLVDRRITKIGQSFKESYDRELGQASSCSTKLIYLTRRIGVRGLKSIEQEYTIKIKATVNFYRNQYPRMGLVGQLKEEAATEVRKAINNQGRGELLQGTGIELTADTYKPNRPHGR